MSRLIHAHDNERTDLGEFTPEKVAALEVLLFAARDLPGVGDVVKVNHPITCLNPEEYFKVVATRHKPDEEFAFRGERTCWFGLSTLLEVKR